MALVELTTVNVDIPVPESAGSTVTEFGPAVIDEKFRMLPGEISVTESVGTHPVGAC